MSKYIGKTIVTGLGFGKITKTSPLNTNETRKKLSVSDIKDELAKASNIYETSVENIKKELEENSTYLNEEALTIIQGHILLIEDEEITDRISEIIRTQSLDFISACKETQKEYIEMFENIDDEYIAERIADIKDILSRFIKMSNKNGKVNLSGVVISKEITPSDILDFEANQVLAIVTEQNTENCHAAILARTLDIPFITNISGIYDLDLENATAIVNANEGYININPKDDVFNDFLIEYNHYKQALENLKYYLDKQALLKDQTSIDLAVNIGNISDVSKAKEYHAKSIGLFRSEYLYMDLEDFPTEDYLYKNYLKMTEYIEGEITIRTLDIGGDKQATYFNIPKEENPFLGYRAIRYCLDNQEVLKTQYKAILRLSAIKNVKIMIPMITRVDEVKKAKAILETAKKELDNKSVKYDPSIQLGIMIETPASVLISDILAKEVDFFSIGTNDLQQYTMASDRNNPSVQNTYSPYSQAIIRMLEITSNNAKDNQIPVSVCGELAANTNYIPILIALGIKKLSVTPTALLKVKKALSELDMTICLDKLKELKEIRSENNIESYILGK